MAAVTPSASAGPHRPYLADGFTLIELLVVVLIIGVLVAVAAPSFLGQTHKAHDSAAKQYLGIGYREAAAAAVDYDGTFGGPTKGLTAAQNVSDAINAGEGGLLFAEPGLCPSDPGFGSGPEEVPTNDQKHIIVSQYYTGGGDLRLCNDPTHTVWELTVTDHQLQQPQATVQQGTGTGTPRNTVLPVISDNQNQVTHVQVGDQLSVDTGTWIDNPTSFSYQWQSSADGLNWADIAGATSSTYDVTAADEGRHLRAGVIAANDGGQRTAYAVKVGPVLPASPVNDLAHPPLISDSDQPGGAVDHVQVSDHLQASTGDWSSNPSGYSYQWQRSQDGGDWLTAPNGAIAGATSSTYDVTAADEGYYLRVVVQAHNAGGDGSASSDATGAVLPATPINDVQPLVANTTGSHSMTHVQVGDVLQTSAGSWTGTVDGLSYTWQAADDASFSQGLQNVGGDSATYNVTAADLGRYLRVSVQASNSGGAAAALSSNHSNAVLPATPVNLTSPTISDAQNSMSHIQVGDHLSTTDGSWSNDPTGFSYQWQRSANGSDWTDIAGEIGSTYTTTTADLDDFLRVIVQAQNDGGQTSASSAATSAVLPATPFNTSPPSITDAQNALSHAQVGDHLSTTDGTWDNDPTGFSYQWQRADDAGFTTNLQDIGGATSSTYTIATADLNSYLRVVVQGSNSGGAASVFSSNHTGAVLPSTPQNTTQPLITNSDRSMPSAQVGDHLSVDQGSWDNCSGNFSCSYSYQWQSSTNGSTFTDVAGATSANYVVLVSDAGNFFRVVVQAQNSGGQTAVFSSNQTTPKVPNYNTSPPAVSGTSQVGQTLTASTGVWTGSGNAFFYQWENSSNGSSWTPIAGATSSSYVVQSSDLNKVMRITVQAQNAGGQASASSGQTTAAAPETPVASTAPSITNTTGTHLMSHVQVGDQLAADPGTWTNCSSCAYTYTWQRSANSDFSGSPTPVGSNSATYNVTAADKDLYLRVSVQATNGNGGQAAAFSSNQTNAILPSTPSNDTAPALSDGGPGTVGSPYVGDTLSTDNGGWSNCSSPACSYTYQWFRGSTQIAGATSSSYTLVAADAGQAIKASVQASNSGGAASVFSNVSGTVIQPVAPAYSSGAAISGTAQPGSTLTAAAGTWTGTPAPAFTYQWQRCDANGANCAAISGATSQAYTLSNTDGGSTFKVVITGTNVAGNASTTTAATAVAPIFVASGGTTTTFGGNEIHTFTSSGTFTVSAGSGTAAVLAVGGGGGGGNVTVSRTGGGGGGGGVSYNSSVALSPGTYTVTVGAGGAAGQNGASSSLSTLVTGLGGGRGGGSDGAPGSGSGTVGSGGGGLGFTGGQAGGTGTSGQGSNGGAGWDSTNVCTGPGFRAGGGGGAGAVGIDGSAASNFGNGGNGVANSISGASVFYGGGGGGGSSNTSRGAGSTGGSGGGGTGAYNNGGGVNAPTAGAANTGGGGGGGGGDPDCGSSSAGHTGGSGGSGIVIVSFVKTPTAPANTSAPTISGTAAVGSTLTASPGAWSGAPSPAFSYQWQVSANNSTWSNATGSGATSASYTVAAADSGNWLRVVVTGSSAAGAAAASSNGMPTVPVNSAVPTVSGTTQVGQVLSATTGSWTTPTGSTAPTFSYQWQTSANGTSGWTNISGATGSTYTPTGTFTVSTSAVTGDINQYLRVVVTATNAGGASAGAASTAVGQVYPANGNVFSGYNVDGSRFSYNQGSTRTINPFGPGGSQSFPAKPSGASTYHIEFQWTCTQCEVNTSFQRQDTFYINGTQVGQSTHFGNSSSISFVKVTVSGTMRLDVKMLGDSETAYTSGNTVSYRFVTGP